MTPATSTQRPSSRSSSQRFASRIVALVVALVIAPATALAGKAEEAKAHVARASKAHKEGRYEEARVELEAAYALAPRPELLYALGQIYSKLGRCPEATAHYQRYAATQKDPQVAKVIDQAIAACKSSPPPVPAPAPTPALARAPAPAPALEAAVPSPSPAVAEPPPGPSRPEPPVDRPRASRPAPAAPAPRPFAPTRAAPAPVVESPSSPWYRDKLGDGLVLGGIAAAVVGVVEYRGALSDLDAAENRSSTTTLARYHDLLDSAHGKRTASIVLIGAGGALITGGIVRYVLHDRTAEVRGVGVAPARGGGMVTYAGRF